ncbi:NAD(P)-dependent dehydrogenase, short-chain alcohol dehydrogenase family [Fontimonas thermophila]|uniref:NAD(P)-dependent dehydrogenase, short-chain alcohol dehydrogenase family n=1 Tax=Fontimonas thermophila TaxID=1076937 RepID=A0A1I2HD88_9GAMM|nr:SDR family oxidoreductase [Fontimonas thermophila]SFF26897.1 NAD(P)-dependent dehydrogenase, short-chain alcohol dehydrogenase family [Fontimonas thermophila]
MQHEPRRVFITGGGSGLGAAVARQLVGRGWCVVLAGRRAAPLHALAAELGASAQALVLDVTDAEAVEAAIQACVPDALVCSAAILGRGAVWDELTPARFAEVMAINVAGTFHACRAAMRLWRARGIAGDIVNVSSLGGLRGMQRFPGFGAYAASKHAVVGLTEALALEGKPYGIRVNAIAPGTMRTDMVAALGLAPKTLPEDIAPTVEFLLDRTRAQPITGTIVEIHCNDE